MTVAAKCNITGLALNKLNELYWKLNCKDNEGIIVENYIEYLGCSNIDLTVCNPDNCDNPLITILCNILIRKLEYAVTDNKVVFSVLLSSIINAVTPIKYEWSFDTDDFTLTGGINGDILVLTLKPGKSLANLVSKVSLKITDYYGCSATKDCYLTPSGLNCGTYIPCPNTNNLIVVNITTNCVKTSSLIVTKKT